MVARALGGVASGTSCLARNMGGERHGYELVQLKPPPVVQLVPSQRESGGVPGFADRFVDLRRVHWVRLATKAILVFGMTRLGIEHTTAKSHWWTIYR